MISFGSLFTGIGGIDLGLEQAGMVCKWQVETNDFCQTLLSQLWPEVRKYRDVREVGKHNLEPVDLIAGGFPCQPHSTAGKRKGKDDDRNLWPEYLRIIQELRPRWVIGENVPGIITTILDDVLFDLEGEGYTTTTFDIPACAFGANHIRHRIFIVAYSNGDDGRLSIQSRQESSNNKGGCKDMADTQEQHRPIEGQEALKHRWSCQDIPNAQCKGFPIGKTQQGPPIRSIERGYMGIGGETTNWTVEPSVARVGNGIPDRVDRVRVLGNAVVPQVAEYLGKMICAVESKCA